MPAIFSDHWYSHLCLNWRRNGMVSVFPWHGIKRFWCFGPGAVWGCLLVDRQLSLVYALLKIVRAFLRLLTKKLYNSHRSQTVHTTGARWRRLRGWSSISGVIEVPRGGNLLDNLVDIESAEAALVLSLHPQNLLVNLNIRQVGKLKLDLQRTVG